MKKDILANGGILQSLRLELTNESHPYDQRLSLFKEYILSDILGCSSPNTEFHKKVCNSIICTRT